jgi:ketosteroid isomerase-like protein
MEAVFESASQVPNGRSLGDLPLVVLTARNSYAAFEGTGIPTAEANRVWLELQKELASLSTRSTHLFSERDHNLHVNDPMAVFAAILMAVDQVRKQPSVALAALGLPPETLPLRSTREVDRLLERLESAYNRMDAEAFVNLFTEDGVQLDVNRRVHVKGRAAWLAWTRRINAAHKNMTRRHRGRAKVGDWVVAEIEWSGTLRGAAIGAANDRSYRYTGVGLLRLENGRIRQQILYGDYASLTEQLSSGVSDSTSADSSRARQGSNP